MSVTSSVQARLSRPPQRARHSQPRTAPPRVEELEDRQLLSTLTPPVHYDFGTASSPDAPGYTPVAVVGYSSSRGYGWSSTKGISAYDRGTPDALRRDFHSGQDGTFLINLPNGTYLVQPTLGDAAAVRDDVNLWLNGVRVATGLTTQAGQFLQPAFKAQVTNGQLSFRIQDAGGLSPSFALDGLDVLPYSPPVAKAGPAPVGSAGVPVTFSGGATGTGPLSYFWNFGDGGSASGTPTPTHTYASAGAYTATLTVTDAVGGTATNSTLLNIGGVAPSVRISGAPATGPEGTAITLGSAVSDPNPADQAAGFTYAWTVTKNGNPYASGSSPGFTFTPDDDGTYVVGLSATDIDGHTGLAQAVTIAVTNVAPRPNALGPYTGAAGVPVDFVGIARDPSPVDLAAGFTYSWAFGDGTKGSGPTPTHSYSSAGVYTATLTVTDEDGGSRSVSTTVTIGTPAPAGAPTDFQILSGNLIANTVYGHLSWSNMATSGAYGINAQWEQGLCSSWYIEEQRYGEDLIIGGLIHNNTAAIAAGFQMFDWGFAHQAADGSFSGTGDPFHSTSLFIAAVAHACLVIEQSPSAQLYAARVSSYSAAAHKAALWMTSPAVWTSGIANNAPYTHRRYLVADALGFTSLLVGGDATLMSHARQQIQDGLSLQWANGVNPEKGGYDSSYQMVGLSYAELWTTYFPNDPLKSSMSVMIANGLAWEATMILPTGEVSTAGDTRTGVETSRSGTVKTVDWKKAVLGFAYWSRVTGNLQWEADGQRIAQYYYKSY